MELTHFKLGFIYGFFNRNAAYPRHPMALALEGLK